MRISAKADYAVRAAAELAAQDPAAWTTAESVAAAQQVPLPFLVNILKLLREQGVVESKRGADGGHRLARPAADVTVAEVVRAVDGPLASVAGVLVEDLAHTGAAASLSDTWVALRCAIRSVLEAVTLADLVAGDLPQPVGQLLAGDDAWTTRPDVRARFHGRASGPRHA